MLSSTTELVGHEYVTSHNPKPLLLYIQADEYEKHIKIDHNDEIVWRTTQQLKRVSFNCALFVAY